MKLAPESGRMNTHAIVAASIAAITLAGCASLQPQAPKLVNAAQSGGPVQLHKGDTLVVALDSSLSAGYRWQPQPIHGVVLQQIGLPDLLPQQVAPGTVGVPNDTVYRFRANEVGTTILELAYQRPSDKIAAPKRTVRYEVSVVARPGVYAQAWVKSR